MALKDLNTKINEYRDKSAAARTELTKRIAEIRDNNSLSPAGKAEQIAKYYREVRATMSGLATQEATALATKRLELERTLFGQFASDPTSIIAYRDAQERVAQLDTKDHLAAKQMFHTAQISGDNTLAAALLGKALNTGWSDLVAAYSDQHPDRAEQLRDLGDLIHFQEDHTIEFQRTADYACTKPEELAAYTDQTIDHIADGERTLTGPQHWGGRQWAPSIA